MNANTHKDHHPLRFCSALATAIFGTTAIVFLASNAPVTGDITGPGLFPTVDDSPFAEWEVCTDENGVAFWHNGGEGGGEGGNVEAEDIVLQAQAVADIANRAKARASELISANVILDDSLAVVPATETLHASAPEESRTWWDEVKRWFQVGVGG